MKLSRKTINNKDYTYLDLTNAYDSSTLNNLSNESSYYTVNPQNRFLKMLISKGFVEEAPLTLLVASNIDKYVLPSGFYCRKAKESEIPVVTGIGEETYPEWLKHDASFYKKAIEEPNMDVFVVVDSKNKIAGKIIADCELGICKMRALGIKPEYRGYGLAKAIVSYLINSNNNIDEFSTLCMEDAIKFFKTLGFVEQNRFSHWVIFNKKQHEK